MTLPRFKRILLKLSGEVLMGKSSFGIDPETVARVAGEIAAAKEAGHELCLVVGGGNIFRGLAGVAQGIDRTTGDSMGMLEIGRAHVGTPVTNAPIVCPLLLE